MEFKEKLLHFWGLMENNIDIGFKDILKLKKKIKYHLYKDNNIKI
jgi:hypothetical protein